MTDEKEKTELDGLGIAVGLIGVGLLCLWAPTYLEASSGHRVAWFTAGSVFGLIGLGGGLTELSKLYDTAGLGDWGVTVVLGGIAGLLHLGQVYWTLGSPWTGVAKAGVLAFAFWVPLGFAQGLARLVATRRRERADKAAGPRMSGIIISSLTALAGLLTAAANFYRAIRGL